MKNIFMPWCRYLIVRLTWQFANTLLLLSSVIAFFFITQTESFRNFIEFTGSLGYIGAFIAGAFFVFTYTVVPSVALLISFTETLNPLLIILSAGVGSVVGNFVIFHFIRDRLSGEWAPVLRGVADTKLGRVFASPFFAWFLPVVGGVMIALPLPDEIGIGLLGIARLSYLQFILLSFLLHTSGIFIIVSLAHML